MSMTESWPPKQKSCPTTEQLRAFSSGNVADDAFDEMVFHVVACEKCSSTLEDLMMEPDSVSENLRKETPLQPCQRPAESSTATAAVETNAPRRLGRYRLDSLIDRGGFGEVWKAYDPELEHYVAIKIPRADKRLSPDLIAEFKKEGRKLAKLRDIPGIVTVYDVGEQDGYAYIVSELIEGESLKSRLKRAPLPLDEAARLVAAVADILHRAHLKDVVHRDIKPANILLKQDGSPVVADVGLAVTEKEQLAERRATVGTTPYMPPEQITGNSHLVNAQADIYSLGVVLYTLLTGRLPFVADTFAEYRDQIVNRPPRPPRTVDDKIPEKLEEICLKCLSKNPAERYTTARDLARELRRWNRPSRNRYWVAAGAMAAVLVAVLSRDVWWPGTPNPRSPESGRTHVKIPISPIGAREIFRRDPPGDVLSVKLQEGLRITSKLEAVFGYYKTEAVRYKFRVQFRLAQHKDIRKSQFGLFLGFRPIGEPRDKRFRFQTVQLIRSVRDAPTLNRSLEIGKIDSPHDASFSTTWFSPGPVDDADAGLHELEITVGQRGLEVVSWDGRGVPELSTTEANEQTNEDDYYGELGVINRNGSVTIVGCEIVILQRKW